MTEPSRDCSETCSSDAAVKQILLMLNEKHSFIIEDLDDYHLVIKADDEYRVRKELEAEVRRPFHWFYASALTFNLFSLRRIPIL